MNRIPSKIFDAEIKPLVALSRSIATEKYMDDVLNLIVTVAANVTDIRICSLWLIDESEHPKKLRLKASQAIDTDYVRNHSLSLNEGVVGKVATHNQPVIVEDVMKHPQFKEKEMARKSGLVSMLAIPMRDKKNEAIGVLNFFTTQSHMFSKEEVAIMTSLASQASGLILNTELMILSCLIQEELDARELLKQARKVLTEHRKMGEDEAHGWIKKCSLDSQRTIREVAEAILLSN